MFSNNVYGSIIKLEIDHETGVSMRLPKLQPLVNGLREADKAKIINTH